MSVLRRVKRNWWMRLRDPPDGSVFRLMARRWRPVVRVDSKAVPMRLALPAHEVPPAGRNSFKAKPRYAPTEVAAKPKRAWSPWVWVK